jgi:hypothetical protein
MNMAVFKEITEITVTRFAGSPLGKMTDGKIFDKPIGEYDKPLGIVCEAYKNCPIDNGKDGTENNGSWEGDRGNSKWIPNPDFVPNKANPEGKTWSEILDKYGIDGINYKDGEPDFSEISKGTVEIEPFSDSRTDNFDKADIELVKQRGCSPEEVAKWRKENGYTWHECKDMKTMQKVPSEVHNNIPHSGGISEAKKGTGE